jgi:hypothetical protein
VILNLQALWNGRVLREERTLKKKFALNRALVCDVDYLRERLRTVVLDLPPRPRTDALRWRVQICDAVIEPECQRCIALGLQTGNTHDKLP